jgi:hypothetical protein
MYNNEIYDGLKLYASRESISSSEESEVHLIEEECLITRGFYQPFKTEEDLQSHTNTEPISKLLKIIAAGNAEEMRSLLEEFGPIQFLENHFYEKE